MTHENFKQLLERRLKLTKDVLASKSKEYATPGDKLHNFKVAARIRNKIPTESLQGMMDKHLVSYFDILEKIRLGQPVIQSQVDEKIGDIINYFILQEAIIAEYIENYD